MRLKDWKLPHRETEWIQTQMENACETSQGTGQSVHTHMLLVGKRMKYKMKRRKYLKKWWDTLLGIKIPGTSSEGLANRAPNRRIKEKPTSGHSIEKLKNVQNSKKNLTSREKVWITCKVSKSDFQQQNRHGVTFVFHPNSLSAHLGSPKIVKTEVVWLCVIVRIHVSTWWQNLLENIWCEISGAYGEFFFEIPP